MVFIRMPISSSPRREMISPLITQYLPNYTHTVGARLSRAKGVEEGPV